MANILESLVDMLKPNDSKANANKAKTISPKYRENAFNQVGTQSTHLMASSDNYAFPMLFPKDPTSETTTSAYDDWIEYPEWAWKQAMAEAEKRGELFKFETELEAQKFAEGSWKPK